MEEQITQATQPVEQPVQEAPRDRAAENLIAMRRKLEQEEKARVEAERKAAEYERMLQGQQQSQATHVHDDEDDDLGDPESYIEAKKVKKMAKKWKDELTETKQRMEAMEQRYQMLEAQGASSSLNNFQEIVTHDNVQTLARLYPDEYQSMMMNPSMAARSKMAYNMIRNYGIAADKIKESDDRIAKNKAKPQAAALGSPQTPQTPLTALKDYERRHMSEDQAKEIMRRVERMRMQG